MNCQAVIKVGKNKGKVCGRIDCYINGHDKYVKGRGKCRQIITKGRNAGTMCGRIQCLFHNEIADYLELPNEFRNRGLCFHGYDMLSDYLKTEFTIVDIPIALKKLLNILENENSLIKELLIIVIFKLLDTNAGVELRFKHEKFRNSVNSKILEFQDPKCKTSDAFKKYIQMFETGKTFLQKSKNLLKKLKIYTLSVGRFIKTYKKISKEKIEKIEKIENQKSLCIIC
jgi:hypothetical protein